MPAGLARGITFTVAALLAVIVLDAALHVLMAQNPVSYTHLTLPTNREV